MGLVLTYHIPSSKNLSDSLTPDRETCSKELLNSSLPTFVDFFAGSGLVTQGAKHACTPVWSNDICPKKAAVYTANHGDDHFHLGSFSPAST
jgi:adenine-specific DNA methylase